MTALSTDGRPGEAASPRPVPWRRMAWVTWRQHRAALAGVAALLGAWAGYLWLAGSSTYRAYAAVAACHPAGSLACWDILGNFDYTYGDPALHAAVLLQVVP